MRLLGIASTTTIKRGVSRIGEIIAPDIEFEHIKLLPKYVWRNLKDLEPFDGIVSVAHARVPLELRPRTILYFLGSCTRGIVASGKIPEDFFTHPFLEYWSHTQSEQVALRNLGLETRMIYRPNDLRIPDAPPPIPEKPIVACYYNRKNSSINRCYPQLLQVMKELSDIELWTFPNGIPDKLPNHTYGGKIDFAKMAHQISGAIRIAELGDFGRSNFDLAGYGRWSLYSALYEPPIVLEHKKIATFARKVHQLLAEQTYEDYVMRWRYVKDNLNEEALHHRWVSELKRAFNK